MKRNSNFFTVIAAIIALGGVVFGIVLGAVCKIDTSGLFESAKLRFNAGLMIQTWIIADIIALVFQWMAAVLSKLENIEKAFGVDNNSETLLSGINNLVNSIKGAAPSQSSTSNTHFSNSNHTENSNVNIPPQKATVGANEWKCPNCGKIHQNYVGSCGCGQVKPM